MTIAPSLCRVSAARRLAGILTVVAGVWVQLLIATSSADAQGFVVAAGEVVALPGDFGIPVHITISNDEAVNAVVLHLSFDSSRLTLAEVRTDGGVLDGAAIEFSDTSFFPQGGEVTLQFTLDSTSPFTSEIPVGDDQLLVDLVFDVEDFLLAGTVTDVEFTTDEMPITSNQVFVDGVLESTMFLDGSVTISDENYLLVREDTVNAGQVDQEYAIFAYNSVDIQGFSVALTFDMNSIQVTDVSVDGTITDGVGAEFVESNIDNFDGTVVLGVLLDALPPFQNQVISAAGTVYAVANLVYDVFPEAVKADTQVSFVDGLGSPPIDNVFVVDSESVAPNLVDGILRINQLPPFIRGEANLDGSFDIADPIFTINVMFLGEPMPPCLKAFDSNDDGDVDIADPIYSLDYLFQEGEPPPPPFPEPGFDPTPDNIPCE